jgi:dTDP-4-dehydrorhamnose reductase
MISVLVTGANGQLGSEIRRISAEYPEMSFLFTDIDELDITNQGAVKDFLDENPVQFLVNCAAYTAVDRAEDEPEAAMLLNGTAPAILASESVRRNIQLIHISTDYVFDGEKNHPYCEDDPVNPRTVYGQTKLTGEKAVRESGKGIIIRTSWLYSVFGHNFVKTILRLSKEKESLQVVFNQTGSPTNAWDLARAVLEMIRKEYQEGKKPRYDLYHFSNQGICSWYEFALAVVGMSGSDCTVEPVESKDYPTRTVRPRYSVFSKARFQADYPINIPHWKDSLKVCMEELMNNEP